MPSSTTRRRTRRSGDGGLLLALGLAAVLALGLHAGPLDTAGLDPGGGAVPGAVVAPIAAGRVSSGYGPRAGGMHYGADVAAPTGTPIRAVADGTVIEAGPASGFGLWVRIRHEDGTVSVYGHMHTITTAVGARVGAGEQIATVGSRGRSTGPHLHLEIWPDGDRDRRVDPADWLARHGAALIGGPA